MSDSQQAAAHGGFRMWQFVGLVLGPVLAIALMLFADLNPANPAMTRMAAVAVLMAVWWITDAIPLAATSLLPVVLFPLCGIMNADDVAPFFINDTIFLFIGGFLLAIAMEHWDLHRRIALVTLKGFGVKPSHILLGFMVATAGLSMWISNTATAMMMLPIAVAVLGSLEERSGREACAGFEASLLLGIAYAASIGGIATLVGTPPNLVLVRVHDQTFPDAPEIGFAPWMLFALPVCALLLGVVWLLLRWMFPDRADAKSLDPEIFRSQHRALGKMSREEKWVLGLFVLLAALWLSRATLKVGGLTIPGWSEFFPDTKAVRDGTVAIAVALLLFVIPARAGQKSRTLLTGRALQELPWTIVLLFGGGFALAAGIEKTGLSGWIGERFQFLAGLHPIIIVLLVATFITFLTEITSNTATATVMLPVVAANAIALGIDPLLLMVPCAMAASYAFMLPVATPPNAIVFATARLTISQMARAGLVVNIVAIILTTLAIWFLGPLILGIEMSGLPEWAARK